LTFKIITLYHPFCSYNFISSFPNLSTVVIFTIKKLVNSGNHLKFLFFFSLMLIDKSGKISDFVIIKPLWLSASMISDKVHGELVCNSKKTFIFSKFHIFVYDYNSACAWRRELCGIRVSEYNAFNQLILIIHSFLEKMKRLDFENTNQSFLFCFLLFMQKY